MAEADGRAAVVAEMLSYVPSAVPGAVSLQRDSGLLRPGYILRYLKTRETVPRTEDTPVVEAAEVPVAAAWNVRFVAGIVLILLSMALAVLLPAATHERALALTAIIFVVLGLGGLWQSRFTPVEPDRLSLANAVMRARLKALRTDDPSEIDQRIAEEREIGDQLFCMTLPTRNAGLRSRPADRSGGNQVAPNHDRDSA